MARRSGLARSGTDVEFVHARMERGGFAFPHENAAEAGRQVNGRLQAAAVLAITHFDQALWVRHCRIQLSESSKMGGNPYRTEPRRSRLDPSHELQ